MFFLFAILMMCYPSPSPNSDTFAQSSVRDTLSLPSGAASFASTPHLQNLEQPVERRRREEHRGLTAGRALAREGNALRTSAEEKRNMEEESENKQENRAAATPLDSVRERSQFVELGIQRDVSLGIKSDLSQLESKVSAMNYD